MAAPGVSDTAASAETPAPPPPATRGRHLHALLYGAAAVFTAFVLLALPAPLQLDLDASWQAVLFEAHRRGWQFGTELVFTAGPWGWVTSLFVPGDAFGLRLACDALLKLALVGTIAASAWTLPTRRRWLLLAGVLFLGAYFPDTLAFVALTLATLAWLFPRRASPLATAWAVVLLAFLGQVKFTLALLGAAAIATSAWSNFAPGNRKRALLLAGGFVVAWLGWWLAAGQDLANLPAYLAHSWEVARGYPQAMGVDEPTPVLLWGLASLAVFGLWALLHLLARVQRESTLQLAFVSFVWFTAWRHGFTRGDGHVYGFFLFVALASLGVTGWMNRPRRYSLLDLSLPLGVLGALAFDASLFAQTWPLTTARARANFAALTHYAEHRERHAAHTAAYAAQARAEYGAIVDEIGGKSVDLFGHFQSALLLLGANYQPRPVFQSYSAYTGKLLELNAAYFDSARAPEFVLVRLDTIDGRYPAQDDSLALSQVVRNYQLVRTTPTLAVLRRPAPDASGPRHSEFVRHGRSFRAAWGATIDLRPEGPTHWLRIDARPSFLGRLRAFLYKPATLRLVLTDDHGREFAHRFVPESARSGFPAPLLETQSDLHALLAREVRSQIARIRVEPVAKDEEPFWSTLEVCPEQEPGPPFTPSRRYAPFVAAGVLDREPFAIDGPHEPSLTTTAAGPALLIHAPGEAMFAVPADGHELSGFCALSAGAFQNGGATDGAVFTVEVQFPDGRRETVWQRTVDPVNVPADRGEHAFKVRLPDAACVVTLRTSPGASPSSNNSWDWTYWRELRFSK